MLLVLSLVCLSAAAAAVDAPAVVEAAEPAARVLVLDTKVDEASKDAKSYGELLAHHLENQLESRRLRGVVVPASSVREKLAVMSDKMTAGCDDVACMSEIAGAIDTRFVLSSKASKVGSRWVIRVELFDARDLTTVASASEEADGVDALTARADALVGRILDKARVFGADGAVHVEPPPPPPDEGPPVDKVDKKSGGGASPVWWVGGLGGSALAVGSVAAFSWSYLKSLDSEARLNKALDDYKANPSPDTRRALKSVGPEADNDSTFHNCVWLPVGCLCVPFSALAATSFGVLLFSAPGEDEPSTTTNGGERGAE